MGKQEGNNRVCPSCPAKLIRCQSCREHYYKVHLKKEPYECKVCKMKFFHNPNYTEHKKEHPEHTFSKKVWDDDPQLQIDSHVSDSIITFLNLIMKMALFQFLIFQFHLRSCDSTQLRALVNLSDSDESHFS